MAAKQNREVSLSAFQMLHNELVQHFLRNPEQLEASRSISTSADETKDSNLKIDEYSKLSGEYRYRKVDCMGFSVGNRIMAKCTRQRERKTDTLSTVKLVCKDFWTVLFKKSIDKLQTNHRGVYVLHDFNFKLLQHLWPCEGTDLSHELQNYLTFTCGIIRGAFAQLSERCTVTHSHSNLPAVQFHINFLTASNVLDH